MGSTHARILERLAIRENISESSKEKGLNKMQVVQFKEDIIKAKRMSNNVVPKGIRKLTKGERTKTEIIEYLRMGMKVKQIADSMCITRQHVSSVKKDFTVLVYLINGCSAPAQIARVLSITQKEVLDIKEKYSFYLNNA